MQEYPITLSNEYNLTSYSVFSKSGTSSKQGSLNFNREIGHAMYRKQECQKSWEVPKPKFNELKFCKAGIETRK